MTQDDFGDLVGVNAQSVSRWERGETAPREKVLKRIADATGVSLKWLRDGEGPMNVPSTYKPSETPAQGLSDEARIRVRRLQRAIDLGAGKRELQLLVVHLAEAMPGATEEDVRELTEALDKNLEEGD